jgi:hypothetical protein
MKIDKISAKLTSHSMEDDTNIKRALNFLFGRPSTVRVCVQRLKKDYVFPIDYKLTIWYVDRGDWTWEMFMAEHLKMGEIEVERR